MKRLIAKYKKKGTVDRESGQGRKRKLTRKKIQEMRKKAKKGKCVPELMRKYNQFHEEEGKSISEPTVRRGLKSTGLKYFGVEELTAKQITDRLAYASKRLHFDWPRTIY